MKKVFLMLGLAVLGFNNVSAQDDFHGIFNHVGVGVGVGTEGIGINVAAPVTKYLEVSAGVDFMPGFKIDGDVDVNDIHVNNTTTIPMDQVNIEGNFARTMANFKVSCYPFGNKSSFFVAAGFSFGGGKIAKLKGHSDDVMNFMNDPQYPQAVKDQVFAQIDKYNVKFDHSGNINGEIKASDFRPYLGLGFGRLVPKHRVGARVELGLQFHGDLKIYQNDSEVLINDINEVDDDISDIIDKLSVYPVLKFTLTGRIF